MDTLCLHFINSEFRDFRGRWVKDDLQQPEWLQQFLAKWELHIESLPDATVIASLVSLRTLLSHMIGSIANGQFGDNDIALLNTILSRIPMQRSLKKEAGIYRLELIPLKKDWDWVHAEIVASFVHLLTEHDPERLKLCANPHCRWAFYDDSKSRTRRYCTADKCANLWKARRFRARHKSDA